MRGEHFPGRRPLIGRKGSSPRARGAHCAFYQRRADHGIIPACAGSTQADSATPFSTGDHPRVRGEHATVKHLLVRDRGSSPRARGAHRRRVRARPGGGDHPRVRGEHITANPPWAIGRGSSPRARGAHNRHPGYPLIPGIIPACAGSTDLPPATGPTGRDHPRVRGEHPSYWISRHSTEGSSPRARGARLLCDELPG